MMGSSGIGRWWQGFARRRTGDVQKGHADRDLQVEIAVAHREWQAAKEYFQNVSDPELVDHAIYSLEAAQRKYMYLFRRFRQTEGSALDQEA